jgi:hypothetical protein
LVLFKDVIKGCTLSVEGILSEDLTGTKELISLQDSIFCVHLQRQYSASRDLNAFLENVGDVRNIEDESAKKYLSALEVLLSFIFRISVHNMIIFSFSAWTR